MAFSRRRSLCILSSLLLPLLAHCRTAGDGSGTKFGWEDDLTPMEKDPQGNPAERPPVLRLDRSFCRGSNLGECFTFVLRVPTSQLVSDLGLTALALAAQSQRFSKVMDEACQAAWVSYKDRHKAASLSPLRRAFVNRIKKIRCVFVPMSEENTLENLPLADQEMGLSARLTSFEILGRNDAATVGFLKLARDQTTVETSFRSVALFSGKTVASAKPAWQLASAFNVAPVKVQSSMGMDVSWKVDLAAAAGILSRIDTTKIKDETDQAIKAFLDKAKPVLAAFSVKNVSLGSSVLLLGVGYEALKSVCGEDISRCKFESSSASKLPVFGSDAKDFVPSSEAHEVLRTGLIKSIHGIWDRVFEDTDKKQLSDAFKL